MMDDKKKAKIERKYLRYIHNIAYFGYARESAVQAELWENVDRVKVQFT